MVVPWRWVCWGTGVVLLVLSCAVLMLQVSVHAGGTQSASCGSAWDTVAGRTGWQQWWAADLSGVAEGHGHQLVRTLHCPGEVNATIAASSGLALGAVAVVIAGEVVARRSARWARRAWPAQAKRLRLLATLVMTAGGLLTAGGLAGLALLAADPSSTIFLYISRPVVVLVGLLLILPAVLLIALGWGASLMADYVAHEEVTRGAP
jgi:hypothetical protein